jgi:hypothetical protein
LNEKLELTSAMLKDILDEIQPNPVRIVRSLASRQARRRQFGKPKIGSFVE